MKIRSISWREAAGRALLCLRVHARLESPAVVAHGKLVHVHGRAQAARRRKQQKAHAAVLAAGKEHMLYEDRR